MLRNSLKQRITGQTLCIASGCVGAGAVERLFVGERDPLVEFVVEGADGHIAARARADRGGSVQQIVGVGLVGAVHHVERPAGVAAFGLVPEPARKGKAELREAALGADGKLRHDAGNAANGAEENGRTTVDGGRVRQIGEAADGVVVGEELASEIVTQVAAAVVFADKSSVAGWQLPFKVPAVGVAADAGAGSERGLVKIGIGIGGRNRSRWNRGAEDDGGAMALFKAEDELCGSHARGVIELKLTDDASFDLGRVAVRALAFAITQLVGKVRGGRRIRGRLSPACWEGSRK